MDVPPERRSSAAADLAEQIVVSARVGGFAAAGIAPISALVGVPPAVDPERVLPGCRAVVVMAARPEAVVATGPTGPVMLKPEPAETMRRIRALLEGEGWRVASAGGSAVSLPRLAEAVGLGRVGPVGALVAAGEGMRLTLFAVVTDAPLIAVTGEAAGGHCLECMQCTYDCPAMLSGRFELSWCTACGVCVAVCPA